MNAANTDKTPEVTQKLDAALVAAEKLEESVTKYISRCDEIESWAREAHILLQDCADADHAEDGGPTCMHPYDAEKLLSKAPEEIKR